MYKNSPSFFRKRIWSFLLPTSSRNRVYFYGQFLLEKYRLFCNKKCHICLHIFTSCLCIFFATKNFQICLVSVARSAARVTVICYLDFRNPEECKRGAYAGSAHHHADPWQSVTSTLLHALSDQAVGTVYFLYAITPHYRMSLFSWSTNFVSFQDSPSNEHRPISRLLECSTHYYCL